jgi:hypothetical protein
MGSSSRLSDQEFDRLLTGRAPAGAASLEEVAAFFRDVTATLQQAPDEATATRHLSAIAEASRLRSEHEGSVSGPAHASVPPRRRKLVSGNVFASRTAKIALAGVLALGAFSGAAYAGALPGPIQRPTADVANNLGLSLPGADQNNNNVDQGNQNNVDQGHQTNTDQGQRGNTDQGEKSNTDQSQQGNGDRGNQNNTDQGQKSSHNDSTQSNHQQQGNQGGSHQGAGGLQDSGGRGNQSSGAGQGRGGGQGGSGQRGGGQGNGNN